MASRRQRQAAELIHVELSRLIQKRARDPRLAGVTLTSVELSPDLQNAQIYFSVLGDQRAKKDALQGLQSAAGFLRRELADALSLRVMPTLAFRVDNSLERGVQINALLNSIIPTKDDQRSEDDS